MGALGAHQGRRAPANPRGHPGKCGLLRGHPQTAGGSNPATLPPFENSPNNLRKQKKKLQILQSPNNIQPCTAPPRLNRSQIQPWRTWPDEGPGIPDLPCDFPDFLDLPEYFPDFPDLRHDFPDFSDLRKYFPDFSDFQELLPGLLGLLGLTSPTFRTSRTDLSDRF